jgi:pimeloyl-ACP methyl ester carboxylesterase
MRRSAPRSLGAALLSALLLAGLPASSSASPSFGPCLHEGAATFECTSLNVPLDRRGQLGGTLALSLERKLAGPVPARGAVLALAGGPGQAALGLGEFIATAMAPALASRDLLVFDQRGTGESNPLSCSALSSASEVEGSSSIGELAEHCAQQLGAARGDYTTAESVADIESIRQALGYEKLVLYGTSYGTKVALEYAERYPQHVEALVLDSVVPSNGPEPFSLRTFQAIDGVLEELCLNHACEGINGKPTANLARLTAGLRKRAVSGSVYDGDGHRRNVTLNEGGLLRILQAGDLNPALRALLPAAMASALRHDPDPLLRLKLLSEGLIPTIPTRPREEGTQEIDETLFLDTSCEETPFPWNRSAPAQTRLAEAAAALRGLPASDFAPFDLSTALSTSLASACSGWPAASPTPSVAGALPDVPTLLLSGEQDLRTPTANAREVAERIPGAQLLVVPFTGHSVLGSDFSGCAEHAVQEFFSSSPVTPCTNVVNRFAPTPLTPTKLQYIRAPAVLGGRAGKTLTAALDAILDLDRLVISATLEGEAELPVGSSFGGLRGGYARLQGSSVALKDFSFVPGVSLSGVFPVQDGRLQTATIRVSGSQAATGDIRLGSGKTVSGELGGHRFAVELAKVKLASSSPGTGEWPTGKVSFPRPGLARLR